MTTDLRVHVHGPLPRDGDLIVSGLHDVVHPRADDPRYWDTQVGVWDQDGLLIASAAITFVAVRGVARKLTAGLLAMNSPEILRRVFPAYVR